MYNTVTDNVWYGIDANDGAFGLEACYFSNRQRSLKSLDNACRVMAALCRSWGLITGTTCQGIKTYRVINEILVISWQRVVMHVRI